MSSIMVRCAARICSVPHPHCCVRRPTTSLQQSPRRPFSLERRAPEGSAADCEYHAIAALVPGLVERLIRSFKYLLRRLATFLLQSLRLRHVKGSHERGCQAHAVCMPRSAGRAL